jgi:hypothetical protein
MFILDLLLAVFALAPFGLLVLFWKAFHEDRGVHPIYRNAKTETTNQQRSRTLPNPLGIRSSDGNRIGQNSVDCSDHGRSIKF